MTGIRRSSWLLLAASHLPRGHPQFHHSQLKTKWSSYLSYKASEGERRKWFTWPSGLNHSRTTQSNRDKPSNITFTHCMKRTSTSLLFWLSWLGPASVIFYELSRLQGSLLVVLFKTKWISTNKPSRCKLACLACRLCVVKQRKQSYFSMMAGRLPQKSTAQPPPTFRTTTFFFTFWKWGLETSLDTDNIR